MLLVKSALEDSLPLMLLKITHFGQNVLRTPGLPVTSFDPALRQLANDMLETMRAAEGIGLAAQQVGLALQFCVIDLGDFPEEEIQFTLDGKALPLSLLMPLALVNPKVIPVAGASDVHEEGCLSFPGIRGAVERPLSVQVNYQDLEGVPHLLVAHGWFARVIQHENDHLQGVLFTDRMKPAVLRRLRSRIEKIERETLADPERKNPGSAQP